MAFPVYVRSAWAQSFVNQPPDLMSSAFSPATNSRSLVLLFDDFAVDVLGIGGIGR
ncbi:hypothetical protein ACWEFJ_16890 [Actinosynnema sp. NPDC004786]